MTARVAWVGVLCLTMGGFASTATRASHQASRASPAAPKKLLPPVDEASRDPELAAVRAYILAAAAARRFELLLPVLGPTINFDFEEKTPAQFQALVRTWSADEVATFWRDVRDALRLGMARDDQGLVHAPYVAIGGVTDVDRLAIVGAQVTVRDAPAPAAATIDTLSYDLVDLGPEPSRSGQQPAVIDGDRYDWIRIVTPSGKTGWVSARYARTSIDFRLLFQKIDGHWKLTAFAVGD